MSKISFAIGVGLWLSSGTLHAAAVDIDSAKLRAAVQKSVDLLQKTGPIFVKKGACTSCHNQSLPAMAISLARQRGFRVDERIAREQLQASAAFLNTRREASLQAVDVGGAADTISYTLLGLAAEKYPADALTDAMMHYLKTTQARDGRWRATSHRPPLEYSDITTTAISMRVIQLYAPEAERAEYEKGVQRAASWLLEASPRASEEKVSRLLGLGWAKAGRNAIEKAAQELLAEQRPDGGWSQLPALPSDAYATGRASVALHQAAGLPLSDPAYQRGMRFLLRTQLDDGSWYVQTRAIAMQPYFESGFPHGADQWISAAATSWASMALALAVEPLRVSSR